MEGYKMERIFTVHFTNGQIMENVEQSTIILHLMNSTGISYITTQKTGA